MANTKISSLTASVANLAATDVIPVVQTTGVGPVKMTGTQITAGIVGGSDTQVQFNDGGSAFGGDAGLTFNKTTNDLTVSGIVKTATVQSSGSLYLQSGGAGPYWEMSIAGNIFPSGGGVYNITGLGQLGARTLAFEGRTFAQLPTPAAGMIAYITDGSASYTVGATVSAGGGANKVYVYYDGANWKALTASF